MRVDPILHQKDCPHIAAQLAGRLLGAFCNATSEAWPHQDPHLGALLDVAADWWIHSGLQGMADYVEWMIRCYAT